MECKDKPYNNTNSLYSLNWGCAKYFAEYSDLEAIPVLSFVSGSELENKTFF